MADKKGVILLSGGLDSAVVLAIMIDRGYIPYPISINYRQQSQVELLSAKAQVDFHKLQTYKVIDIALE
ncbi:MAG: 7-cyano-7-deazaguanine synthase, partial [Nitrospinota bacterium]